MVKVRRHNSKNYSTPTNENKVTALSLDEGIKGDLKHDGWLKSISTQYNLDKDQQNDLIKSYVNFRGFLRGDDGRGNGKSAELMFKEYVERNNGIVPTVTSDNGHVVLGGGNAPMKVVQDWSHGPQVVNNHTGDIVNVTNNGDGSLSFTSTKVDSGGGDVAVNNSSQTATGNNIGQATAQQNVDGVTTSGSGDTDISNNANVNGNHSHSHGPGHGPGHGTTPGGGTPPSAGPTDPSAGDPTEPTDPTTPGTSPNDGSNWLDFFTSKEVLMTAGIVAGIAAILYGLHVLGNTIKARFRKTARVLYKMQKDFGGGKNGMDMNNALGGVGSKITDVLVKMFGMGEKGKGALGMRPFVEGYRKELKGDYDCAVKSFNTIAEAGKESPDPSVHSNKSESAGKVFNSFTEAFRYQQLNESNGKKVEPLTESAVLGTIMAGITLGRLALKAGQYVWSKFGAKDSEATTVQVTKQSTREVCLAIMNLFFSKYFNMEGVSKKLGMNVDSLADLDKSNVDKFAKLAEGLKNELAQAGNTSKMFTRVKTRYDKMVERYLVIAKKLVNNFEVYTKKQKTKNGKELSEKDSNLLTGGTQKLYAELDRQEDIYKNNFWRVMNAIIASPEYISFIDFIIKDVIPVFKTGLASDADYVLDTMPRVGEYYILTQTNQYQNGADDTLGSGPDNGRGKGNVAIVKIVEINKEGDNAAQPIIKFAKMALLQGDNLPLEPTNGVYDLSGTTADNYNQNAFKSGGDKSDPDVAELKYGKWLSLDPYLAADSIFQREEESEPVNDEPGTITMQRDNDGEEFLFVIPVNDNNEATKPKYSPDVKINEDDDSADTADPSTNTPEDSSTSDEPKKVDRITFYKPGADGENDTIINIDVEGKFNMDDFVEYAQGNKDSDDLNVKMGFEVVDDEAAAKKAMDDASHPRNANTSTKEAGTSDEIPPIINNTKENNEKTLEGIKGELLNKVDDLTNQIMTKLKSDIIDKIQNCVDSGNSPVDSLLKRVNSKPISSNNGAYYLYNVNGFGETIQNDILPNYNNQNDKVLLRTGVMILKTDVSTLTNGKPIVLVVKPKVCNFVNDYMNGAADSSTDSSTQTPNESLTEDNTNSNPSDASTNAQPGQPGQPGQGGSTDASTNAQPGQPGQPGQGGSTDASTNAQPGQPGQPGQGGQNPQQNQQGQGAQPKNAEPTKFDKLKLNIYIYLITASPGQYDPTPVKTQGYNLISTTPILYSSVDELKEKIKAAIGYVINNDYSLTQDGKFKNGVIEESVSYEIDGQLAEMQNRNVVHINRHIASKMDTRGLYIISEQCWGDGQYANPQYHLSESFRKRVINSTYYDLAKEAKNKHNISIMPFNESAVLNVTMPYYRYSVLTKGCPLYEHLAYLRFDSSEDKNVEEIYELGVFKYVK